MKIYAHKGASYKRTIRKKALGICNQSVKRILVIRHAAFGDMVLTRPFLKDLRSNYPKAHIILSISSDYQVAIPKDLVDEVHTCFTKKDNKNLIEIFRKMNEIEPVDLLFDLAATSRSMQISFLTKAKIKMGFPYQKNLWVYDICLLRTDFKFEAELLLDFLSALGVNATYPLHFSLPEFSHSKAHKRILYFMGASNNAKKYPEVMFQSLIEQVSKKYPDYEHHILQGQGSNEKFKDLYEKLKHLNNIKLIELMSLDKLALYLSESRLLVSNDTGVKNYGICTHTPTLVISVSEHPFRYIPRYEFCHYAIFNDAHKPVSSHLIEEKISHILKDHYGTD